MQVGDACKLCRSSHIGHNTPRVSIINKRVPAQVGCCGEETQQMNNRHTHATQGTALFYFIWYVCALFVRLLTDVHHTLCDTGAGTPPVSFWRGEAQSAATTCCVVIVITWWALCWGHSLRLLHQGRHRGVVAVADLFAARSLWRPAALPPTSPEATVCVAAGKIHKDHEPRRMHRSAPPREGHLRLRRTAPRVLCTYGSAVAHSRFVLGFYICHSCALCCAIVLIICGCRAISFAGRPRV